MAATGRFKYTPYHPINRLQLAPALTIIDPVWTEVVNGSGELTGAVTMPTDARARKLVLAAVEPDESWIVVSTDDGRVPWTGFVTDQEWKPELGQMKFTAQECRGWLDEVFLRPKLDMTADIQYTWSADQLYIAQQIVQYFQLPPGEVFYNPGSPVIVYGTETSGKVRDLNIMGTEFKTVANALDSISKRDGGFEYTLGVVYDTGNLPLLALQLGYPVLGGGQIGNLRRTDMGGNIISIGSVKKSSKDRRTRQWSTGAGQPPDQPFAQDSDPGQAGLLLREAKLNYSSVIERTTLSSHSRSVRQYYSAKTQQVDIVAGLDDPDVTTYRAGDRVGLTYKDDVVDWNYPSVRIIQRKVAPSQGKVTLTLDLNDLALPQVDAGGAV